ncbi:MAG: hypothetical protein EBU59_07020 [Planctomycetia bacterium]|nr:hypothetical protein [Planctomycetia bacterium]
MHPIIFPSACRSLPVLSSDFDCGPVLARLSQAAEVWRGRPACDRAKLAQQTAKAVAGEVMVWAEAAIAFKSTGPDGPVSISPSLQQALLAEELATGPVGTLRLAMLTARVWDEIDRQGLPTLTSAPRLAHRPVVAASPASPATLVEVDVLPKAAGDGLKRLRYRVVEVRQHISSWADISDVPNGRVILQTSETDRHDGTKMVVIGTYLDTTSSTRPIPVAKPQICD